MYEDFVLKMNAVRTAKGRSEVIAEMCRIFGFCKDSAYRALKECGWESNRKKRSDAGSSSISEKNLSAVAALLQNSLRKNGKKTMSIENARSIMMQNGFDIPIGNRQLAGLLKSRTLSTESTAKQSPYQRMRTEYPNQVHFADPSVALMYFAPNGGQKFLRDDEVYKNKPFLEGRESLKCWRYVLTDHFSGTICVKYYAAAGENSANMYDFLLYAWGKKSDPLYNFHGLPELLIWDCGSANISKPVTNALKALRVETKPHMPGNPRAKGQVEKSNDIVERQFESLLRLEPVSSIEELNDAAERWCAAFNANALEGRDTRIIRNGKKIGSRTQLWNWIEKDQLRELPDAEICRQIFTTGIQVRTVGGDLAISFVHPKRKTATRYSLSHLPDIMVGQTVNVQPILVSDDALTLVSYKDGAGEIVSYEVKPIEYDAAGFDVDAPVFGKEYKSLPDTLREKNTKALAQIAAADDKSAVPFAGITDGQGFKTHSLIRNEENPWLKTQTGKQVEIAAGTVEVHDILISTVEMAKRFKARAGYLPDGFISYLKKEYPDGVPAQMVDDLVAEYDGVTAEKMA
ncbi:DDE-type integrase/transposase/recombinase [Treponema pectinovorum]|uniref:DDE-type integrase/transposase/recombinase n=1 Tax=Treponema pectinovorum TaxID=164 RepID=UPI0011C98C90|nr:DDE-type integrase/transposase/recombinase [Treponema pectinovorum]